MVNYGSPLNRGLNVVSLSALINIPNNTFWALALERKWAHMEEEKKSLTPMGFEPTTSGTVQRCSTNLATRPDESWSWEIKMVICGKWTRNWRGNLNIAVQNMHYLVFQYLVYISFSFLRLKPFIEKRTNYEQFETEIAEN